MAVKTIEAKQPCTPGNCPHKRAEIVTDLDEVVRLLRECKEPSFDLETTGYNPFLTQVECMSFSVSPEIAMWVPFIGTCAIPMSRAQSRLKDELDNPDKTWILHLGKFDFKHAWHKGFVGDPQLSTMIPRGKIIDTCIASRKLDENKYSHELKELVKAPPFYHTMVRYDEVKRLRSPQADLFMSAEKVLEEFKNYSCLHVDSRVRLADGSCMGIGEIVKKRLPVEVLSVNEKTGMIEPRKVIQWFSRKAPGQRWLRVLTERTPSNASPWLTPDHPVWTARGWIEAQDVRPGDHVLLSAPSINQVQRQMILGSCLGDGSIVSKNGKQAGFQVSHCTKQFDYLDIKKRILGSLFTSEHYAGPETRTICGRVSQSTGSRKILSIYTPTLGRWRAMMYPDGKKTISREWLDEIDEMGLAFFYLDDGTLATSKKGFPGESYSARLFTHKFGECGSLLIQDWLKSRFSIESTLDQVKNHVSAWIVRLTAAGSRRLFDLIAPFVPFAMDYKIGAAWRGRFNPGLFDTNDTRNKPDWDSVVKVEACPKRSRNSYGERFCLGVEGNQNFFTNTILVHNCEDAVWDRRLWFEELKPKIDADKRLAQLFYEMECRVTKALCAMEIRGITLDIDYMQKLDREFGDRANKLVQEAHTIVGHPFEIDSPDALYRLLFEELQVGERGELRRTQGGRISVDADTLEKYSDLPIVQKIMQYKALAKLRSTYTSPLIEHARLVDGRIRSVFNQVPDERFGEAAVTGRLSSSDPNLQNIPIRPKPWESKDAESDGHKIRNGFVAPERRVFIVADNSQVELRMLAHITKDKELLRAYRRWDCHECKKKGYTNKPLHQCPECGAPDGKRDKKDPKQPTIKGFCLGLDLHTITALACNITRDQGKIVNFALAGGMGVNLFSKDIGLPRKVSDPIREAYFDHYAGVWEWFKTIPPALKNDGYVKTIMGSYRRFPQCVGQRVEMFSREWRQAANGSFQASAADVMKIQLRNLYEEFARRGWLDRVWIILVVHDEFIIECPIEMKDEVLLVTRDIMENAIVLDIPILVSIGAGRTWGSAKA